MDQTEDQSATKRHGLTLQATEAFFLGTLPAMAEHTFPFICSVIGVLDPNTGRHCGTALRCLLNGRRAILTAFHVIDEARGAPKGLAISTGYGETPYLVDGKVDIDISKDLAVYYLPDGYPDKALWPSARIDRSLDKLGTDFLFVHGFPGSTSYSSRILGGVVNHSLPYGAMQRLENLPADMKPFQFAVEYDPGGMVNAAGVPQHLIDPHGLSGSPVWRIGVSGRSSREWKPDDSLLVGILTQWRQGENVLIATSAAGQPTG